MPALPVGDDVQHALGGWHVVGVAGGDGLPGVAAGVGLGDAEGGQEPCLAVGAVVGEGLAGPLAGDQDAAPRIAQTQLQDVYEQVFGIKLDKRNFRKKVAKMEFIQASKGKIERGRHRPHSSIITIRNAMPNLPGKNFF